MKMQQINHHLTDPLLMGYSAGALPEAFNLVVATHISMCDTCRAALAEFDAVGGEVMLDVAPVAMSADALAATLALIDDMPAVAPATHAETAPANDNAFPSPLRDYLPEGYAGVKWRKIGGGVCQAVLPTSQDATVRLLKIPAGVAVPDHGHNGTELTLVLRGAFVDEHDRFGAGDIEVANEDLEHTPVAEAGEDCICLAATDAPLRFNSLMPRLAQRFIGI